MAGTSLTDTATPRRSPALLALVFGVFLVIIGVTAEALVRAFVQGIRTAADPPLPDMDVWRARIWTPSDRVA